MSRGNARQPSAASALDAAADYVSLQEGPFRDAADPSAWLTAYRRLARDYERDPAVSGAMIRWAAIATITRRIARGGPATRQQRRTFPTPA